MSTSDESTGPALDTARVAALAEGAADILFELGFDGRLHWISRAVLNVLGRPTTDFVGKSFLEIVVPDDREHTLALFQKITSTGAEPVVRFRVPNAEGLRVELEATVRHVKIGDRRTIACSARDITQQSAETAVARERAAHYRHLVESGSRPAAIMRHDGRVVFANHAFTATFGRGNEFADVLSELHEGLRLAQRTAWSDRGDDRTPQAGHGNDFAFPDADGREAWYSARWEIVPDDVVGGPHFAVYVDDVTARKRVELALRSIARGIAVSGRASLEVNIRLVEEALDFERVSIASIDAKHPGRARIVAGFGFENDGEPAEFELEGLPEAAVAEGDVVTYPSGITRIMPAVAELVSPHVESFAGVPLRRADGEVIGFVRGYARNPILDLDLTRSLLSAFATQAAAFADRRAADEVIRSTRDRFEALAAQSHEILSEIDEKGRVLYSSAANEAILGFSPEEMLGRSIPQMVHPDDRAQNRVSQARLFNGAAHTYVVNRIRHKDGRWRWLESRSSSFTAPDGSKRALILSQDVTDRRSDDLGRELLYQVVQAGGDLVFVCDVEGRLVFANQAATRRLTTESGPTASAPVDGQRLDEVFSDDDARRLRTEILPKLSPAQPWSGTLRLSSPEDGHPIETEAKVFLVSIEAEDEGRSHIAVTLRDVEARRQMEEALAESELRLSQAQKMEAVGRLAGGIAHDFNNLLTAIIGYSDLVIDELGEGHVARGDAQEILRAAERAGGLTRQLLAFSRRQVLQPEPIDLNHVVADIDRMMRRLIGEDIELHTVQDGELRSIMADPGQIEQVIVNLVVNAQDAMPRGGRLTIETANAKLAATHSTASGLLEPGEYATLRVTDTGVGMEPETAAQIFEPFFTTKEAHRGTGLGLATVYGIVSQSGGQIDVETVPGEGTTFTVYLPAATVAQSDQDDGADRAAKGGRETILLLEDSAPVRKLVHRALERAGYTVLAAESSTAALRHCTRHQGTIDLLLTDVVLPKTPGPEVARRAEEIRPGLRVLYMSGFTDETLARHGLEASRVDLLEKPFTPSAVLARVRTALDRDVETP